MLLEIVDILPALLVQGTCGILNCVELLPGKADLRGDFFELLDILLWNFPEICREGHTQF